MKTSFKLMTLAAALALVSCAKELPSGQNEYQGDLQKVTLNVSMPQSALVKTVMGDKNGTNYPVYWAEGDVVSLNGYLSNAVTSETAGSDMASFAVELPSDMQAPYNLLYPGQEGVADQVTFPAQQTFTAGTFATNTLPMYATANTLGAGFSLDYLGSVIRVPIKFFTTTTIKAFELKSRGGEALSGTFTLGKDENGAFNGTVQGTENSTSSVTLTFAEGQNVYESETETFHFVIPAGVYSEGIEMTLFDTDGGYMKAYLFTEEGDDVVAGKVYEYGERSYIPDGHVVYIYTPEDLVTLAKRTTNAEVYLMNDIDMSEIEYNSDSFNFYGSFDGQGHSITGLTTSLFNNLEGSLKNLNVTANIVYNEIGANSQTNNNNPYGIGIIAHYAYSATEEGDLREYIDGVTVNGSITVGVETTQSNYNIGGLVGACNGIPMSNCVNNATVTLGETFSGATVRLGGIAGAVQTAKTANVTNCVNNGSVSVSTGTATECVVVAGIAAHVSQAVTFASCVNNGAISFTTPFAEGEKVVPNARVAGLVGYTTAGIKIPFGKNTGAITFNTSVTNAFVGGVAALIDNKNADISYSSNEGEVTVSGEFAGMWIGGVLGSTGKIVADYIKNSAPMTVKNAHITTSVWLAGCIGRLDKDEDKSTHTITGMENTGNITMKEGITTNNQSSWQYIGGVLGSGDSSNKILENCTNKANIDARPGSGIQIKVRMGGLAGIVNKNPKGSRSEGDVSLRSSKGSNEVGGLIGYLNTGTYEDLTFIGTVLTNGTSGTNYIGGLIGNVKEGDRTFKNCTVSGTAHGGNGGDTGAGLFCNATGKISKATFIDCKIGTGSHRKAHANGNSAYDYKFETTTEITEDIAKKALTAAKATEVVITDEDGNLAISVVDSATL